ncbi:MAG: PDGLE domain-containing protein [Ignisphaera sp.]|nr:PDGLE domain-containing protein [Ignisphaera sp.]MCX8168236.1 PDGLE domain-containing protein [Ignisphaera sp.]MDW8084896.1 PDGLE domain-containing protein [Ignisphaera sp.]
MNRIIVCLLIVLITVSPLFSIYLANLVGYREPLDIVAEELRLNEVEFSWTPLKDYVIPGLPDWLGYVLAGSIGVGIIFVFGFIMRRLIARRIR